MQPGSLCPVFRPSLEEFSNFASYVETIEEDLKRWGICKVGPVAPRPFFPLMTWRAGHSTRWLGVRPAV